MLKLKGGKYFMGIYPKAMTWLHLVVSREVNQLLSGGEGGNLDVDDMRRHTTYSGGYCVDHPTIKLFWKV